MAWADTTRKAEAQAGGVATVTVSLAGTVAGNHVMAGCSAYGLPGMDPIAVSDGGNTWTDHATAELGVQAASLSSSKLGTGGTRSIVFDPLGANNHDFSAYAHEFSGGADPAVSGTPIEATGTTETTSDTGAFTPTNADALYVAVEGNTSSGTITENVAPGDTNWTFSNDHESGTAAEPGSMVFFILSGAAVSRRSAWTIPSGANWAAVIAGFKPAAAGAALIAQMRSVRRPVFDRVFGRVN